jgi:hypothetical protein
MAATKIGRMSGLITTVFESAICEKTVPFEEPLGANLTMQALSA